MIGCVGGFAPGVRASTKFWFQHRAIGVHHSFAHLLVLFGGDANQSGWQAGLMWCLVRTGGIGEPTGFFCIWLVMDSPR